MGRPMFQKRHYEALAEVSAACYRDGEPWLSEYLRRLRTMLGRDNPEFDGERFMRAARGEQ